MTILPWLVAGGALGYAARRSGGANTKIDVKVVQAVRLETPPFDLFAIAAEGRFHLYRVQYEGGHEYSVMGSGDKATVLAVIRREVAKSHGKSTRTPSAAVKHALDLAQHPFFGVTWDGPTLPSSEQDFANILARDLRAWKGRSTEIYALHHPYWPKFHAQVVAAVRAKYGPRLVLYRGIGGDRARRRLCEGPQKGRIYTSWTTLEGAKEYRGEVRKNWWVLLSATIPSSSVILAPVVLPNFTPNPDILSPLAYDVAHTGDEFILKSPPTIIKARTRREC